MTSDIFFENNSEMFDLIYVDGNHHSFQVKKDLENSYKFLNPSGILIIDDFLWDWYEDPKSNPAYAVNNFSKNIINFLKILFVHNIVILQKKILMKNLKVVILAGGFGTRLMEETKIKPKPLVKIGPYPIIQHVIKTITHIMV